MVVFRYILGNTGTIDAASHSERGASFHSSFSKWKQIRPPGGSRLPLPFALELAKLLRLRAADPPSLREFNDPPASSHCLTCSKAQHFPGVRCERASRHPSWPRYSFGSQAQFWLFRPFPISHSVVLLVPQQGISFQVGCPSARNALYPIILPILLLSRSLGRPVPRVRPRNRRPRR